jgi:tetratricopeptide (TPR) repeat protein
VFVLAIVVAAAVTASPAEDRAAAEVHLHSGNDAFRDGNPRKAIAEYLQAYDLFPNPKLFYNLGQAYEAAGMRPEALESFRHVLRAFEGVAVAPDSDLAGWLHNARDWAAALEVQLGSAPKAVSETPPLVVAPAHPTLALRSAPAAPRAAPAPAVTIAGKPASAPTARSHRALWWVVAAGAVAAAATTFFIISASKPGSDCPSRADLGCI